MSVSTPPRPAIWKKLILTGCLTFGLASLPARAEDAKPADKPAEAAPARPQCGRITLPQILKIQRERLDRLNLTDEQKKKLDEIYANAEADLKKAGEGDLQAFGTAMKTVGEKTHEVLTDEQKAKLPTGRAATGGPGAAGGPITNVIERLEKSLDKLDLSADQKAKTAPVVADAKKKFEELRSQLQTGDRAAMREKFKAAMDETRDKLKDILTPEQAAKLKADLETMRPGAGRPGGPAAEAPAKPVDK